MTTFKINVTITINVERAPDEVAVKPSPAKRTPVDSSFIKSVGFQATAGYRGTLEIEFANGHVYQYAGVPEGLYDDMMDDYSIGAFFNRKIKPFYEGMPVQS